MEHTPKKPNMQQYHKDLDRSLSHLKEALDKYLNASSEDRIRLKGVMEELLKLISSAVSELKRSGISKESSKLEKACKAYIADQSSENLAALEHEIATLREFNV